MARIGHFRRPSDIFRLRVDVLFHHKGLVVPLWIFDSGVVGLSHETLQETHVY